MIPSFHPRLVREPLGPVIARIDLSGTAAMAEYGARIIAFGGRVDGLLAGHEHGLLVWLGADLELAFRKGLAAATAATSYSAAATSMLAVQPTPRPPDLAVLRTYVATAEIAANERLAQRLRALRRNADAELAALRGAWRHAIDRAGDRLDPTERVAIERAYSAVCAIDLDACWPRVVFEELEPVTFRRGAVMSSGGKSLDFTTRQRAISSDHNRLQRFGAADRAEAFRRLVDMRVDALGGGYIEAGSYVDTISNDAAPVATPLRADVFDGLVVLPQSGTLNLLVSPGAVGVDDPDGQAGSSDPTPPSSDDSRYKIVVDPGVNVVGALTIAAGAGSTRIDLVECRRQSIVLETDSRDVFDPSTGLFVPVALPVVERGGLLFRVRQGTPGAGIPALQQGWLPLCVASVPSSATTVDTMTFWDVRPLVADRVNAPHASRHIATSFEGRQGLYCNDHSDPSKSTLSGISSSQIGMYRAGGLMPAGPGLLDVRNAANQASGYSPTIGKPWFLYAVFPASLPRWVQYLPFPASPRVPSGPLGIIAISEEGPSSQFGTGDTLNPPAATGLGTAGPRALLGAGVVGSGPREHGFIAQEGLTLVNPDVPIAAPAPSSTLTSDVFTLSPNAHFPATARAVRVLISATFSGATPGTIDFIHQTTNVLPPGGSDRVAKAHDGVFVVTYAASGSASVTFEADIPCIPFGTLNGEADDTLSFRVEWSTVTTRGSQGCSVIGWRL